MRATLWFDGACSGNPGPMGAGAVVQLEGGRPQVLSQPMGRGTNNEAEYHGLLLGLRHALAAGADEVVVRGDSQLVLRQLEGAYKVRAENLRSLNEEARRLLGHFAAVRLEWVPRAQNAEADAAATAALRGRA
ncbi:MAG TPA: ribonuclease HI family protein [Candidatus Thermoplasmatota archaeon]|nr:ribonuclease HI family protein [Candidatus Thermoplasmatota archaeon]